MRIIDIHSHTLPIPGGDRFLNAQQQIAFQKEMGIEKSVLLPVAAAEGQYATQITEGAMHLASQYPDNFVWFCKVDPRAAQYSEKADLGDQLSYYKEQGAKGLGELTATLYADDPKMDDLFGFCEELELPVTIHIAPQLTSSYGVVDDLGLPRIEKMLKKHKDMKLLGHSAPFWSEISTDVDPNDREGYPKGKVEPGRVPQLMREYGNLYGDLSAGSGRNAMMRDPEFAAGFLTEFADRLLFGTDVCNPGQRFPFNFYDFLQDLEKSGMISLETLEKIMYKNAEKLLGL